MDFEFDVRKSESNKRKHGIDFLEAQSIWEDPDRIEIPAKTEDEPRTLVIGKTRSKHWTAIVTARQKAVRVISVRRSRQKEIALYESEEF